MLDAYATAITGLFQPLPMLALFGGVILGLISGALPGGGLPTLIVLLGFAYYMDPYVALPLAIGFLMAVHFWRVRKDGGISGPL